MKHISPFFRIKNRFQRQVAIFLSGHGTNAEKVLENWKEDHSEIFYDIVLFTDRPNESRAKSIANKFGLPLVQNDIKRFYQKQGCHRVTLTTPLGQKIREEWTMMVRDQLKKYKIDFGIFAGFIPLTNITSEFPCLNVHPGDLTFYKDGVRHLVGLHTIPIERAILEGLSYLRSSVIVAQPYDDNQRDMDKGPVLGISDNVDIDLLGYDFKQLKEIASSRPSIRPRKGYQDELERIAKFNQERLKTEGDWVILPQVAREFSEGNYAMSEDGGLFYRNDNDWIQLKTIIFGKDKKEFVL